MNDTIYMTKMATSFLGELSEIEKQGFAPMRWLGGGIKRIGQAASTKVAPEVAEKGLGWAQRLGGQGAVRAGGLRKHISQIYQAGAKPGAARTVMTSAGPKEIAARGGGMLGGLGALARSRYGQMAGAGALGGLGAYGAYRGVTG